MHYQDVTFLPSLSPIAHYRTPSVFCGAFYKNKPIPLIHHFKYNKQCSIQAPFIKPVETIYEEVIYGGFLLTVGHFWTESLANITLIKKYPSLPVFFSYAFSKELKNHQKETLELLQIKNKIFTLEKPTLFKSIHISEPGMALGSWLSKETQNALGTYSTKIISGKKLYISRSKINGRGACNEKQLEYILKNRGWKIFHPQDHPIKTQLYEIGSSEIVFTIAGSALHLLLLFKELSTKFIVIPRVHDITYDMISNAKSNNYYIFNVRKKVLNRCKSPVEQIFDIDINEILDVLIKTNDFNNNLEHIDKIYKPQKPDYDYTKIPNKIYNANTNTTTPERIFYFCLINEKLSKDKKALKQVNILFKKKWIEQYMQQSCFRILNNIEQSKYNNYILEYLYSGRCDSLTVVTFIKNLYNNKKYDEVFQEGKIIIKNYSDFYIKGWVYRYMALIYENRQESELALEYIEKSIELLPDLQSNYGTKINCLRIQKKFKKALESAFIFLNMFPDIYWGYIHTSRIFYDLRNIEAAIFFAYKAVELNKNSSWGKNYLESLLNEKEEKKSLESVVN